MTDTAGLAQAPFGPMPTSNIAIFNIEDKTCRPLTNTKWNEKQPAFSPDGKSFIFVSDRNGIDNLYIASLDDPQNPRPLTDYAGNCSNPDWAADGSAAVFDLFMNQSWNVWYMKKPEEKTLNVSALAPTRWVEYEEGKTTEFFRDNRRIPESAPTQKKKKNTSGGPVAKAVNTVNKAADTAANAVSKDTTSKQNSNSPSAINNKQATTAVDSINNTAVNIAADTAINIAVDTAANTVLTDTIPEQNSNSHSAINYSQVTTVTADSVDIAIDTAINTAANTVSTDTIPKQNSNAPSAINNKQATAVAADSINNKNVNLKPHKDFVRIDSVPSPAPYRLRFTPDFVIFGLGVSTYSGAAGQAVATFSDIMGDHRITLAGDLQIDFTEYAQVYAAYHYLKHRVNTMAAAFYYKNYSYDGRLTIYHDLETGGILGLSYPFSMFSRADLQLTGSRIERVPVASYAETDSAKPYETNLIRASLGFSYDNILWGITGPLKGVRAQAQLHASPPLGFVDQSYLSADIDVRHYTHILKRFVWANRLAAGASFALGGGEAARRFLLGGSENWFNYGVNIDNYRDNLDYNYSYHSKIVTPLRGWYYFDLEGDRMLMLNSEFRFPFIREISIAWPLPIQIRYINGAFFIDNGYAWTEDEQRGSFPLPPKIVSGFGFGMRANLGIFVLRYDRGWPTDWSGGGGGPVNYFSLGAEF